jgi:hypothetical protein
MRKLTLCLVLSLAAIFTGCTSVQEVRNETKVEVATPSPLDIYEQQRKLEINFAEQTRSDFMAAFQNKKAAAQISADPLQLNHVTLTENQSGRTQSVQVFESLSLTLPLALKKNPDYVMAMSKIKALAEKMADERGYSEIQFFLLPTDAAAKKIKFESDTVKSPLGNPITVSKSADKSLKKGMQRIVVKAAPIQKVAL